MKAAVAAIGVAVCAAGPASALSCLAPDVASSFGWAAEAEEAYVVLHGTFSFAQPPSSLTGDINAPREVSYTATFSGDALGRSGFTPIGDLMVTVTHGCAAAWCGSLAGDVPTIAFVEKQTDGYALTVGPCGGQAFARPTRQMVQQVEACMRGDTCEGGLLR
ncbi:hypothetical protein [Pseudooctadecabacter sp.]|uniref:hypothetical protein n=1 Tax=Pseudooctadecabacter sp. TaxID=1966338 RepID=UPI0035C79DDF